MGVALPGGDNEVIEVRQVQEMSDFRPEVQEAAGRIPETQAQRGVVIGGADACAAVARRMRDRGVHRISGCIAVDIDRGRPTSRDRRGLADRVGQADRRPGADRARRRPRRGAGAGRSRRRARAVARVGRPGQPGRLAHGHREASRDRSAAPQQAGSNASTRSSAASSRPSRMRPRRISTPRSTTTSATTSCGSMFTACHPVLSTEARVALTLRLLGGLTTEEIARAFLVPEPTIAQRIVRAKRTLAEARVPFEVPRGRRARRAPVVGARGHLPGLQRGLRGDRRRRLDAAGALRGRAAAGPHPGRACCRRAGGARPGRADGDPGVAPRRARGPVGRARSCCSTRTGALGPAPHPPRARGARARRGARRHALGPYALQAAIAACHAARRQPRRRTGRGSSRSTTRSPSSPSPVVELNRAVAVAMAFGPAAGLELVDALTSEPSLQATTCCRACAATCSQARPLRRGRAEFERAASLTRNARERELLLERAAANDRGVPGSAAPFASLFLSSRLRRAWKRPGGYFCAARRVSCER